MNFDGLQHFVYRLTITDGPWIERVYPLGAQRGTDVKLQLGGQNATADPVALRIPDDAPSEFVHRIESNGRLSNPIILDVDNLPERLEAEPNDTMEQAALIEVPSMLNGRIDQPGDVDGWSFDAVKDQAIEFEVRAARLGSLLDSVIVIEDLTGKELARNDDAEASDSRLQWKAPAEGKYLVKISERFSSRGGEAFAYRLRVAPPEPNFDLRLSSDALSVDRNGAQKLEIQVYRFGGFAEPITLSAVDLPEGVTCADVEVKGNQPQAKAQLEFKAAETARVDVSRIRIVGRATLNDQAIERAATFQFGRGEPALDQLTLAVAEPTPFKFAGVYEFSFASRGGTHHKLYTIERNGYDGPLEVRLADRQTRHLQGIEGPTITVPVGATEFEYPVYLAPWMELGRTSRSVLMLTGEVTDGQGQRHKVCYSSGNQNDQIIIRVSPGLLRLVPERKTLIAEAQSTAKLLVQVKRDRTLDTPVRVELVVPDHMRDISCEPVDLNPNDDAAELTIQFGSAPGPLNMPILIRATSWVGEDRFIGETPLELVEGPSSVGRK